MQGPIANLGASHEGPSKLLIDSVTSQCLGSQCVRIVLARHRKEAYVGNSLPELDSARIKGGT